MSSIALPDAAQVVIVGGGIIGCSVAYHLVKLGYTDVIVLEQGQLSSGTTWHAAGLVGQSSARAQGVAVDVITAKEAGDLWPVMETQDLLGGIWLPGDGKANPTDLTQSLAAGARSGGARIMERTRVTDITVNNGAVESVRTERGDIKAEVIVNCAGQWARNLGQMCDVSVPLHSAEHMYIVTGKIDGVHAELPVLRDPDGFIYFKEEVGGLASCCQMIGNSSKY